MAYDAVPDTLVYRFELKFFLEPNLELSDAPTEAKELHACLVPLEELKGLTRDVRNLRRISTESRHEGERLFNDCLCLNQTEQGATTHAFPPIRLPWKADRNFLCIFGMDETVIERLGEASTVLIAQALKTVRLLGFSMDRTREYGLGILDDYEALAKFILLFREVQRVVLVSDRLTNYAELERLDDEFRSSFKLSTWYDWVGRVDEAVINTYPARHREDYDSENGSDYESDGDVKVDSMGEHLLILERFCFGMMGYEISHIRDLEFFSRIDYGMIFRTVDDWDVLLWDDESLEKKFPLEMMSDTSTDDLLSEDMPSEYISEADEYA